MSKETNELKKKSNEELLALRKELVIKIMGSYGKINPIIPPMKRGKVRLSIARIDTILGERKLRGFNTSKEIST